MVETCMVPDVIQKLQNIVDEQHIHIEQVSAEANDLLGQIKTLRNQFSSIKNAIYNAQEGLKDLSEKRNAMCDLHYMKSKATKQSRPWEDDLRLDKAVEKFINENQYEESLNYIPNQAASSQEKEDRPFACTEDGCTSDYKKKKDLNRHVREKHAPGKGSNAHIASSEEETKNLDFNENMSDSLKKETQHQDNNENVDNFTGHADPDFKYSDYKPRSRGKHSDKEVACDECEYVGRQDRLKRHKETVHSDLKPFTCSYCEFASKRKDKLKNHIEKKH